MALIRRVSRLLRADLHAVLDQLEEPDVLLRQAIREMEQSLSDDEAHLGRLVHRLQEFERRERELAGSLDDPARDQELDLCFENGAESLAKGVIRRRLEREKLRKSLAAKRTESARSAEALQQRIDENRIHLQQIRQQAELVSAEQAAEQTEPGPGQPEPLVDDQQVELALLREKQKRGLS